jgi:hypothetical protein
MQPHQEERCLRNSWAGQPHALFMINLHIIPNPFPPLRYAIPFVLSGARIALWECVSGEVVDV